MTMLITLIRNGERIDWASCHSGELALDLVCIMLRQQRRLEVGDRVVVEALPDWPLQANDSWRKELQI